MRLYSNEIKQMHWREFSSLLSGLSPDSPLGRLVQIRTETDKRVLEHFTPAQRRIRAQWLARKKKPQKPQNYDEVMEQFKNAFLSMAQKR